MTDSHHTKNDLADAFAYAFVGRRQGKSYTMGTNFDTMLADAVLADAVAALPEVAVPANPDVHEWFIEQRGLVYQCAMLRKTAQRQVETANRMRRWESFDVWRISLLVPKQHPLAMRYSMARVEGAQKRKQRVEAKLQSFRPLSSITVTPSVGTPGALLVFIGSESDKLQATLAAADFVDKLAECM